MNREIVRARPALLLVVLGVLAWTPGLGAEPVQLFVEDLKVELKGWSTADAEALGKALAADLQGAIVKNPAYAPMTYENLESQLRKEKRAEQLSCSKSDQACIQKILDNYGCEERLYGTVRQVGEQVQVSLTRYRNEQLVPGGAGSEYAKADAGAITEVAKRLAANLFGMAATSATGDGFGTFPSARVAPVVTRGGGPMVSSGSVTEAVGDVTIDAKPRDSVRLEVTDPRGATIASGAPYKNAAAIPGTWRVRASATGCEAVDQAFDVPVDEVTVIRLEVKPYGSLKVEGTPVGAKVTVSGPGGFSNAGGLPWAAEGLPGGAYRVQVTREGYTGFDEPREVRAGSATVVSVALSKAVTPPSVAEGARVPPVDVGQGSAQGFCEKNDIRNVVVGRAGAIRACYEQGLGSNPELKGTIDLRWAIDQEGRVQTADVVATTLHDASVEDCVLRNVRRMKFAKPKGGICIVKWPFAFKPASSTQEELTAASSGSAIREPTYSSGVTWTDPKTGLVWQRVSSDGVGYTWNEAWLYCDSNAAGLPGKGWRVPTPTELLTIVRKTEKHTLDCPRELEGACEWRELPDTGDANMLLRLQGGHDAVMSGEGAAAFSNLRCVRGGKANAAKRPPGT